MTSSYFGSFATGFVRQLYSGNFVLLVLFSNSEHFTRTWRMRISGGTVVTKTISKSIQEVSFTVSGRGMGWELHNGPRDTYLDAVSDARVRKRARGSCQTRTKVNPSVGRSPTVFLSCGLHRQFLAHSSRPRRSICVSSSSYHAAGHICPRTSSFFLLILVSLSFYLPDNEARAMK